MVNGRSIISPGFSTRVSTEAVSLRAVLRTISSSLTGSFIGSSVKPTSGTAKLLSTSTYPSFSREIFQLPLFKAKRKNPFSLVYCDVFKIPEEE
jgi:hypothetical protein